MWDDYEKMKEVERPSKFVKEYLKRHPCQQLAVQQLVLGFDECGWSKDNSEVEALLHQRFACLMASQLVEDINNQQKNFKQTTGWGGRYRRPETSMFAAVDSDVVSKIHRFDPLNMRTVESVDEVLPEEAFHSGKQECSIPANSIVSTTAASPYFSTAAEHMGIAWAGEAVIRRCVAEENWDLPRLCWQGFFGEADHCLVFKMVVSGVQTLGWHLALHHYPDSAVMAIPVDLVRPPGVENDNLLCVDVCRNSMIVPVVVTNLEHVVACPLVWRSWSWQVKFIPQATDRWQPAVRCFRAAQDEAPILQVAAKAGWWNLSLPVLEKIGSSVGCSIAGGDDLFANLFKLTQKVLEGAADDELMQFLQHRLKRAKKLAQFADELLSIDDALVCLDEGDQQEVHRMQAEAKDQQKVCKKYKESYRKRAGEIRVGRARTAAAKRAAAKPVYRGPTALPGSYMSQAEAKKFMPVGVPKTWLWRSNTPGAWQGRVGELPCVSRNDTHHGGEQFALRLVLQQVWSDWLPLAGWSMEDCPIDGLFDLVDPRARAPVATTGSGPASSGGPA